MRKTLPWTATSLLVGAALLLVSAGTADANRLSRAYQKRTTTERKLVVAEIKFQNAALTGRGYNRKANKLHRAREARDAARGTAERLQAHVDFNANTIPVEIDGDVREVKLADLEHVALRPAGGGLDVTLRNGRSGLVTRRTQFNHDHPGVKLLLRKMSTESGFLRNEMTIRRLSGVPAQAG